MNMQNPTPASPFDALSNDELLMRWQDCKNAIEVAKTAEMEIRKYIVTREFPQPEEGTNTKELGEGFKLKAVIKYNYRLPDNDKVEEGLKKLEALGNQGPFIADRLVGWTPSFKLTEFRVLEEDAAKGDKFANDALAIVYTFLEVSEAAPTLEIKEPKVKK